MAIDDYSLPLKQNLCYYMSKPTVRVDPVLRPSQGNLQATDGLAVALYGSVLYEKGRFRMWYYGLGWKGPLAPNAKESEWTRNIQEGPICYAESLDGVRWTKPILGQVEHNGSRNNNAIALPGAMTEGAFVIRDDSELDPKSRYKMVYECSGDSRTEARTATSADGITWTPSGTAATNLEPSSFYKYKGLYTINAQNLAHFGAGGHSTGRQGFAWVSTDFKHWQGQACESFFLPETTDPSERGYDLPYVETHLGVGAVSMGNVLVGLYCQWYSRPNFGDWFGAGTTYGDLGLVVSNDGLHFREPVKGYVFMKRSESLVSEATGRPEVRYAQILTQSGNAILNVGDETRIYHGRWMNAEHDKDYYVEIALATLPRDRWGALGLFPHAVTGSVWTAPLTLGGPGSSILLNGEGVRGMNVEVANANFHLLPGFSGNDAGTVSGLDGFDCAISWPKGDLGAVSGQKVRLLIHLTKDEKTEPRLFAVYLRDEP